METRGLPPSAWSCWPREVTVSERDLRATPVSHVSTFPKSEGATVSQASPLPQGRVLAQHFPGIP